MAEKEYIDLYECRDDFYATVLDILSEDSTNDRANQIIDAFDYLPTADVVPVRHGHWVKEKSDVLTDTDKWIEQISNMVFDVNPAEIASHIQNGTLKEWCLNWQREMNMLIITAPLDYSNSKEREENA